MSVITKAFFDTLSGDATLIGLLSTYRGGAAVFTQQPVPDDADLPFVVTAGEVSTTEFDTKTTEGREILRDIRCYADDQSDLKTLEDIAERVRELFHRQDIPIAGFQTVVSEATGPFTSDEDGVFARIVTIRMKLQKV